ncbi:MAG: UDP-N-acetylmuramate:L-alanyl-gamma-D-glutamyl-meso-diaminopimelate ligase [Lautropia sp.]|nr:UDP-N-acetylmuramate:L-alanyl-gamma-D-glutamyl-meso-diaminopimelate ligase [Lautropia sp.]
MHIHILGICGTFMGGVAALAKEAGHRVTGCDANVYPPMSDQLRALGIDLVEGFGADQLALRPDVWLIGNVVTRGNPLMEAILDAGQRYTSGPQWLAEEFLHSRWVLAVAGTHGKTTTASMLAWILEEAGLIPGFLIGGVASDFRVSARLGSSRYFVIEADEYDTAFFDKRSKFVHYRPRTAILNNLEYDHADIFRDLEAIEIQFHHLVRTVPRSGKVIHEATQASLQRALARGCWSATEQLGGPEGWRAERVVEGVSATEFMLMHGTRPIGVCSLPLAGAHNRANAIAAVVAAGHVGVDAATALAALSRFGGVKRRLEVKGSVRGVTVLDDFAHHPTAIETTIAGLRARMEAAREAQQADAGRQRPGRLLAVVEPRSNTMKLGAMKALLAQSLAGADLVFCHGGGLGWDAAQVLAPLGRRAQTFNDIDSLVQVIVREARDGDQVLVMSNGGFGGIHGRLLAALAAPGYPAYTADAAGDPTIPVPASRLPAAH